MKAVKFYIIIIFIFTGCKARNNTKQLSQEGFIKSLDLLINDVYWPKFVQQLKSIEIKESPKKLIFIKYFLAKKLRSFVTKFSKY